MPTYRAFPLENRLRILQAVLICARRNVLHLGRHAGQEQARPRTSSLVRSLEAAHPLLAQKRIEAKTMTDAQQIDAGRTIRREVLGPAYVSKSAAEQTRMQREFQRFTLEHCMVEVILQCGVYAGVSNASEAFQIADRVILAEFARTTERQ